MKKLAFILLAVPLLWNCSKKSPTTAQSKTIFAEIYNKGASVEISAPVIDSTRATARVIFGNVQITLREKTENNGRMTFSDTFPISVAGSRCSLEVNTLIGSSRGAVWVPNDVTFRRPLRGETLPWGDNAFIWSRSVNATWYEADIFYSAYDSNDYKIADIDTQLVVLDTVSVIPAAFFRKFSWVAYLSGCASVRPFSGPRPGEVENMNGDIRGFLLGSGNGDGLYTSFLVGTPPPIFKGVQPPRKDRGERRRFMLRAFGLE
jgi:hypothetical protein